VSEELTHLVGTCLAEDWERYDLLIKIPRSGWLHASAACIVSGDEERSAGMGSDAEREAMAGRLIYGRSHMTIGGLAAEYGFTDLDGSQADAWRYLVEAETDNGAGVAVQR
jgi:hypothetical protein